MAKFRRRLGDNFANPCRPGADIPGQPAEVIDRVVEVAIEIYATAGRRLYPLLQPGEAADAARESKYHAAELANELQQFLLGARLPRTGEGGKELMEALNPVGGELNRAGDSVNQPSQDDLHRLESTIPLSEVLEADRVFLPLIVNGVRW